MNRKEKLEFECWRLHYSIKKHMVTGVTKMNEKINKESKSNFSLNLTEVKLQ